MRRWQNTRIRKIKSEHWVGPLPYTLLVAPGGKILYRKQGENDPLALKKAVADHLGRVYK